MTQLANVGHWPTIYNQTPARDWMHARIMAASTDPCTHDYGYQPGADGKVYAVCRKCGHAYAYGGKR